MRGQYRIDWKKVIPKLVFLAPLAGILLYTAQAAVLQTKLDYPAMTFFILLVWLTSEALEIVVNRLGDPIEAAVRKAFKFAEPSFNSMMVNTDQNKALEELKIMYSMSRKRIDGISWRELSTAAHSENKREYFDAIIKRLNSNPHITYRRLLWRPDHLDWLTNEFKTYNAIAGAEFRYFIPKDGLETPIIPCVIVDQRSVNFGWGYLGHPGRDEVNVTLSHKDIGTPFTEYFENLWDNSITLKEENKPIDRDALDKLRMKLNEPKMQHLAATVASIQVGRDEIASTLKVTHEACKTSLYVIALNTFESPAERETFKVIGQLLFDKPNITTWMLFWSPIQLEIIQGLRAEYGDMAQFKGLELAYWGASRKTPISLLPCVIVDKEIVNFGLGYFGGRKLEEDVNISFISKDLAMPFVDHFTHLWNEDTNIILKKKGEPINEDELKRLNDQLSTH